MLTRRATIFGFAAVTLGLLVGCPVPQKHVLYNNSGESAAVVLADRDVAWPVASVISIGEGDVDVTMEQVEWIKGADNTTSPTITIRSKGEERQFLLVFPDTPDSLVPATGSVTYKLQLEPDLRLYLVPFDAEFPFEPSALSYPVEQVVR